MPPCGALWSAVESCGALWRAVESCGELWRAVVYLKEYQRVQSTDNVTQRQTIDLDQTPYWPRSTCG
nr:MAG TPA: hypothetical protein [Caudoviricetes sp.]